MICERFECEAEATWRYVWMGGHDVCDGCMEIIAAEAAKIGRPLPRAVISVIDAIKSAQDVEDALALDEEGRLDLGRPDRSDSLDGLDSVRAQELEKEAHARLVPNRRKTGGRRL